MPEVVTADLSVPSRALAVGAHPDDIEFGCGATLAKWAEAGCAVHLLVLTDGSKGTWDATRDRDDLVEARRVEQRAAADALGAEPPHFGDRADGELDSGLGTRAIVCRVIRATQPEVVLGHDPWKRYRIHPDHRHAGLLTLEGIVAARDPLFFPDQALPPHRPAHALLFEAEEIDHVERIEPRHLDARVAALLAHTSQWESTMHITGSDAELIRTRDRFVSGQLDECRTAGRLVDAELGEAFKRIDDL